LALYKLIEEELGQPLRPSKIRSKSGRILGQSASAAQ
jgi:hypothetical protein